MSKKKLAVSVAFLSIFATNVMANECPKNFQEVIVTGTVNTQNIPAGMQVGTIDMQLTSVKKDKLLFDQVGAIVGQITSIDASGFPILTTLDHEITFADNVEIETNGDTATVYGDPNAGEPVDVVEVINNFHGTKNFKNATGTIIATGQLNSSFEPDGNGGYSTYNSFLLSGSLCIKD
jgi:hypothetical protein